MKKYILLLCFVLFGLSNIIAQKDANQKLLDSFKQCEELKNANEYVLVQGLCATSIVFTCGLMFRKQD